LRYFLTLLAVIRAYTLGVFVKRYRFLIDLITDNTKVAEVLGLSDMKISTVPAGDMLDFIDGPLAYPVGIDGNLTTKEVIVINHLVKTYDPKRIFEIGTFNGRTTLNLALNSRPDTEVFTLDLLDERADRSEPDVERPIGKYKRQTDVGRLFLESDFPEAKKIVQLFGDSAAFDFSPYYGNIDFVFVDGSHEYEYVRKDTDTALMLLRDRKGVIVWHDYDYVFPGVVKALNELYEKVPFNKMVRVGLTTLVYLVLD
jgi:predicted O-methyltransferase YrrM